MSISESNDLNNVLSMCYTNFCRTCSQCFWV